MYNININDSIKSHVDNEYNDWQIDSYIESEAFGIKDNDWEKIEEMFSWNCNFWIYMLQLIHQVLLNTFTTWVQNSIVYCPSLKVKQIRLNWFFCFIKLKKRHDFN